MKDNVCKPIPLIFQDQASGERSQDQWSSGCLKLDKNCTKQTLAAR